MATKIYLDANAIIQAIEGSDSAAAPIALIITSDATECVSSELTLAEALVGVWKDATPGVSDEELAAGYERLFADNSQFRVVAVDRPTLRRAAKLRATDLALKLPDAIHLASALADGCDVFLTGDRKLLKAALREGLEPCSVAAADLEALLARVETTL